MNDAFGSAHRAHASTVGVAQLLPAYAGLLLLAELENLGKLLGEVERPFVIVSGGAKVEDKIGVLENLGSRADEVLIGGKMAEDVRTDNPFSFEAVLPIDVVAAASFDADADDAGDAVRRAARRLARARHRPGDARGLRAPHRRREDGLLERADGRLRVAEASPRERSRSRARSRSATGSPSSAAATRCAPCTTRASPIASRGSRPAAAPRSSCSKARSCPASRRSRACRTEPMLIAGNWKMFKGPAEAGAFCRALRDADLPDDVDVVVCPPYVSLADSRAGARRHRDRRLRAELPLGARRRVHG